MTIEDGRYIIVNAKSNTVLDLSGGDGYSIIGFDNHGGENQQWDVCSKDGGFTIRNVSSGKHLSFEGDPGDSVKVVANDIERIWEIQPDANNDSALRILVQWTPFNVDLSNYGDPTPGTPVELWGRNEDNVNQTWFFNRVD